MTRDDLCFELIKLGTTVRRTKLHRITFRGVEGGMSLVLDAGWVEHTTFIDSTDNSLWFIVELAKVSRIVRGYREREIVRYEDALLELVNTYVKDGVTPDNALEMARGRLS